MGSYVVSDNLFKKLYDAGLIPSLTDCTKVILVLEQGEPAKILAESLAKSTEAEAIVNGFIGAGVYCKVCGWAIDTPGDPGACGCPPKEEVDE